MPNYVKNKCVICESEFEILYKQRSKKTCSKKCSYKVRNKTRYTKHEPLEKTCKICNQVFQDTSKKKLVDTCTECVRKKMVSTRKNKGSYTRTEEQNKKLSETLKKKYEDGWNPNTKEHKEKLSKIMKNAWASGDFKRKSKETCRQKYGTDHWMKISEAKLKFSDIFTGRKFSIETRKKMSKSAAERIRTGKCKLNSNGNGYFRKDLNCYFRSNWEANFARICNYENLNWQYEPDTFFLKSGKTYTPDFKIDNVYYEIKGRWLGEAFGKFQNFKLENKECKIELVDGKIYKQLRSKYKHLITWEGK
jgi:hypothetical protein